jgi:hypothetical protein
VLRLVTGAVAIGHLPLAKHWLEKKADVLSQLQLPERRIAFERCSSEAARVEEIEKFHGRHRRVLHALAVREDRANRSKIEFGYCVNF